MVDPRLDTLFWLMAAILFATVVFTIAITVVFWLSLKTLREMRDDRVRLGAAASRRTGANA